ncbi:MAG: plasmid mobilization relaxosome protein MobC [Lachnospiraceae bacterium]|nr:plasmid mobilization relaxosome protein MobC [Lachnospiraceae bacterium]
MRKRNHAVTIRMTEKEYAAMQKRIKESGRTQQAYIINSALNAQISSAEEISTLKEVSASFADLVRQLRGIATNINQMTRIANSVGIIPSSRELSKISDQIAEYRKESENEWQSIRSLTAGQKPTQG